MRTALTRRSAARIPSLGTDRATGTSTRDEIPKIDGYADGHNAPTPSAIDFKPGELLGCVSGELGLREFLESNGHTLVVTSDKYVSVW